MALQKDGSKGQNQYGSDGVCMYFGNMYAKTLINRLFKNPCMAVGEGNLSVIYTKRSHFHFC